MNASPRLRALCLLLGVGVGFALAVWEGHRAATYSKPGNFRRIHQAISPEASFYPTFAMLENLALARRHSGQTVVIVGGNSILHGVGQNQDELWSLYLQELLGDRYVVVNLAFRGSWPSEGGALVAESMLKRGIPVLYIANTAPGPVARAYESTYDFIFWDARAQDGLLPNPARDTELNVRLNYALPETQTRLRTKELAARLNHGLRFQELWHHVAYRHFSTVWSYVTHDRFWRPRRLWPDGEPSAAPLDQRFRDLFDIEMLITRGFSAVYAESDASGEWHATPGPLRQARIDIDEIFPAPLRPHMLLFLSQNAPYYRQRLTPAERARDTFVFATYEQLWRELGITSITAGTDFTDADYRDRTHLSPEGGRKLARLVAGWVHSLEKP